MDSSIHIISRQYSSQEAGAREIENYLSHLATQVKVSASTQNQALSALLFLDKKVLDQDLPWLDEIVRAKRPTRVRVVLSRNEVVRVLDAMHGTHWLMGQPPIWQQHPTN